MKNPSIATSRENSLTVAERVGAALRMSQHHGPSRRNSVAEICRLAGVSRANLYASYPQLVTEILGRPILRHGRSAEQAPLNSEVKRKGTRVPTDREKALLYLCLELQAEIHALRALQNTEEGLRRAKRRSSNQR